MLTMANAKQILRGIGFNFRKCSDQNPTLAGASTAPALSAGAYGLVGRGIRDGGREVATEAGP